MKTIKFEHHLAERILAGEKTITWRLFDDKELSVGDELEMIDRSTGAIFAHAVITDVHVKTLATVEDNDYDGHERYESEEEMLKTFQSYYGERVTLQTPVKIIRFRRIA